MNRFRSKRHSILITGGDRKLAHSHFPNASIHSINARAAVRAAAREILVETKSTAEALDCLTMDIPAATLRAWMKDRLKAA